MKNVILSRLQTIPVAGVHPDLVMSGMVVGEEVSIDDGKVIIPVHVPDNFGGDLPAMRQAIEDKIKPLDGIDNIK